MHMSLMATLTRDVLASSGCLWDRECQIRQHPFASSYSSLPAAWSSVLEGRSRSSPAYLASDVEGIHVASHYISGHMLGQEISWVISPEHLGEFKITTLDTVLYPQVRYVQVPYLAKATPSTTTNADRSSGIN